MGKITVKHYLNMNLKSYKINGDDYYSVYILVSANRQNTKVKSIKFNELYTESDYNELVQENHPNLNLEITAITNIVNVMINVLGDFDTSFFTLLYTSSEDISINPIIGKTNYIKADDAAGEYEYVFNLKDPDFNKFGISIIDLLNKKRLKLDNMNNISVLYWYSDKVQAEFIRYIQKSKCKFKTEEIKDKINLLVFYLYLNILSEFIPKKNMKVYEKYKPIFDNYKKYLNGITVDFGKYQKAFRYF